jgi:basic membrane lipoprotein Med (substrate-binding protein (PBP1-ABC) superfamily)
MVKDNKFNGDMIWLDMPSGSIDFVYNESLKSNIPDAVIAAVEDAKQRIISGALVVPKDTF